MRIGCRPASERSTIASRVFVRPSVQGPHGLSKVPSLSGPRCLSARTMRSRSVVRVRSVGARNPAIPHMRVMITFSDNGRMIHAFFPVAADATVCRVRPLTNAEPRRIIPEALESAPSTTVCCVSSCGGHLTELLALRRAYERYPHFYVLNERVDLPPEMHGRTTFIRHAERDMLFLVNLLEAWRILRRERPRVILSTGAGPAVPFALVGKLLGIPSIFVEISAQVTAPSLTGRIMSYLAETVFYQWRALAHAFPRGVYGGLLR